MTNMQYIEIQIPPKFFDDHADRCIDREVPIGKGKGNRIAVKLTEDEIADLYSDCDYYWDPSDLALDHKEALALCMSARATLKAIVNQVENIDDIRATVRARAAAKREAWLRSPERAARLAEQARKDAEWAERDRVDPLLTGLRHRRILHPTTGEVVEVSYVGYNCADGVTLSLVDQPTTNVPGTEHKPNNRDWRVSDFGIKMADLEEGQGAS